MIIVKPDIIKATAHDQLCSGLEAECEVAVHAVSGGLIRFFTIITVLRFLRLNNKYDSIICILLDIPYSMLLRYGNKKNKKNKSQNVVIRPPPRKVIVEWILSALNDISCETIRKSFKSCALTTAH